MESANKTSGDAAATMAPATCIINENDYDIYCLIPAFIIIIVLAFLNKRVSLKKNLFNGRPALVIPINFLGDSTSNRLSIAVAFGCIASDCFQLFNNITGFEKTTYHVIYLGNTPWIKAVNTIVFVLFYGTLNFPILACLMADNQLVSSIFGLLYTTLRFVLKVLLVCTCGDSFDEDVKEAHLSNVYTKSRLVMELPIILCFIFLLVRFVMILWTAVRQQTSYSDLTHQQTEDENNANIAKKHDFTHVRLLLKNQLSQRFDSTQPWYIRLKNSLYMRRDDFKYSTELISTLAVGAFFVYHLTIYLILTFSRLNGEIEIAYESYKKLPTANHSFWEDFGFEIVHDVIPFPLIAKSFYISTSLTCGISILLMLNFIKRHREHVLNSFKKKIFLSRPSRLVLRNLNYPGYQIAYIGWGYIIMVIILFLLWFVLFMSIRYWDQLHLSERILHVLPYVIIPILLWVFQRLLGMLLFRDRRFPDLAITVNNHRLYCIMSFFFFFFNILIGFYSSIFRTLKSLFLGVFFLSRLDKTPLMAGFQSWDNGYLSYIGFLNVLKASSHPVMLVFCHILTHCSHDCIMSLDSSSLIGGQSFQSSTRALLPSSAKTVCNRWYVAYTLLHNPQLKALRKRNIHLTVGKVRNMPQSNENVILCA